MNKINKQKLIDEFNAPVDKEQLKKIIYTVFALVIFLLPIIPERIGVFIYSLKYTFFNLTTIVTTIILLVMGIVEKNMKLNKYDIILSIYLVLVILSAIFTKYDVVDCILGTDGRGEGVITIFSYIATFCIMSKGYKYIKDSIKIAIIAAIIVSVYGLIQTIVPAEYDLVIRSKSTAGVATGTMGNQNFFSSYTCIFLPMMCYLYLITKKKIVLPIISLLFFGLIFSKTLGGYLTFAGMYIIIISFEIFFSKNRKESLKAILILSLVLLVTFGLSSLRSNTYFEELKQVEQEVVNLKNKDNKFGTYRLEIWQKAIMVINKNKLLGTGPDNLKLELIHNDEYTTNGKGDILNQYIIDKAHCEYLHIAATTGIPSLVTYLLFIGILMIELLKGVIIRNKKCDMDESDNKNKIYLTMLFMGIISYLVQALGNISVIQVAPIFWSIIGLAIGNLKEETR